MAGSNIESGFTQKATRLSFLTLRVLGASLLGFIGGMMTALLPVALASIFFQESAGLDAVYRVSAVILCPVIALSLWFTLFRAGSPANR